MISDVLSAAVIDIDEYLATDIYEGPIRERIIKMRDEMEAVRIVLDMPPFLLNEDGTEVDPKLVAEYRAALAANGKLVE
jgi:hypothetical protein